MIAFSISLIILLIVALGLDTYKYVIPNWLVGLVIALYPIMVLLSPVQVDWLQGIYTFLGLFAAGFIIFTLKFMGGGDVKLLAALGLWTGVENLLDMLFITGLLGGLLAVALLAGRSWAPWFFGRFLNGRKIPRVLCDGEPLPYGIAISVAFLTLLLQGHIVGAPSPF